MSTTPGQDEPFTQPDVHLESETARVFIELKVGATIKLEQVQKYLLLHAYRDALDEVVKTPYLFFIQQRPFDRHWQPEEDRAAIRQQTLNPFLQDRLRQTDFNDRLANHDQVPALIPRYNAILDQIAFGTATWQQVGEVIAAETQTRIAAGGELAEMIEKTAGDLLRDLAQRKLWKASTE